MAGWAERRRAGGTVRSGHVVRRLRQAASGQALLVRCAWCMRLKTPLGWVEAVHVPHRLLAESSHGICPDCFRRVAPQHGD